MSFPHSLPALAALTLSCSAATVDPVGGTAASDSGSPGHDTDTDTDTDTDGGDSADPVDTGADTDPPDVDWSDVSTVVASAWETRLDLDDDGVFDHAWAVSGSELDGCELSLSTLDTAQEQWRVALPSCSLPYAPLFHWRSFLGDETRDFTLWVNHGADDMDYWLYVGDGSTGALRDWSLFMGDGNSSGTLRLRGVATVDYQIADYAGPSLLVRTTGSFHGRLFHFPGDIAGAVEVSADSTIIDGGQTYAAFPFPGADLPGDAYTSMYRAFNWDLESCEEIAEVAHYACGVPDETGGGGYFLDKIAVGDIDGDGVEDAHMTYLWRSVVYPGKPKGNQAWLGAPQYDVYYNPQADGSDCHSGRHYGLSILAQVDFDSELEVLDLAGTPVDNFRDIYQNVSRNIAMVDAGQHVSLPTTDRWLGWNLPFGTMIPTCAGEMVDNRLYDGVLHIPSDGRVVIDGATRWVHANVFSQTSDAAACPQNDFDCYTDQLQSMTGTWSWQLISAADGSTVYTEAGSYVWDVLEDPRGGDPWVLLSTDADVFNIGTTSFDSADPWLRSDLAVARLDPSTSTLVDLTPLATDAKPFLQYEHWQQRFGTHTMNFNPQRLATLPSASGDLPAFVLRVDGGYAGVAWDDDAGWVLVAL